MKYDESYDFDQEVGLYIFLTFEMVYLLFSMQCKISQFL
jgi:hypothetical protein